MNANTYIIFVSLALVMLTVVGGIGSVAGALMGGILAGTAFQALTSTFTNLSTDHGGGGIWNVLANLSLVAPALIGISLGRNPSGAVPQIVAATGPCGRSRGSSPSAWWPRRVAYVLTLTNVMGNWWFVLATGAHRPGAPARSVAPCGPRPSSHSHPLTGAGQRARSRRRRWSPRPRWPPRGWPMPALEITEVSHGLRRRPGAQRRAAFRCPRPE